MKQFLSLLILPAIGCGLISAAKSPDVTVKKDGDLIVKEYKMEGKTLRNGRKITTQEVATRSSDEALYSLTVDLQEGEVEGITGKEVAVVSRDTGKIYGWPMDEEEWEPIEGPIMVPPGLYDIVGFFNGWIIPDMFVFADGVEVKEDMTVVLNASDADKEVSFKPLRPNGEGMIVAPTSEDGTCCQAGIMYHINGNYPTTRNAYSVFWSGADYVVFPEDELEEDELVDTARGFMTNGTSSFFVGWSATGLDFEYGNLCIAMPGDIKEESEVSNSIDNYKSFDVDFIAAQNQFEDGEFIEPRPSMKWALYWHGKWIWMESGGSMAKIPWNWKKNYICNVPGSDYVIGINPVERALQIEWYTYQIEAPGIIPSGNNLIFSSVHPGDGLMELFNFRTEAGETYSLNPMACHNISDPIVLGGTVPVTTLLQNQYEMAYYFYGRAGELRTIDDPVVKLSAKRNGELVTETSEEFKYMWWEDDNLIDGEWDISIINSNLEIDGLQGTNEFNVHLNNSEGNLYSPAVSGLWFENVSGSRQERFTTGADGKMVIYAGDFLYKEFEGEDWWDITQWFECEAPEKIEVEYAPYGSDSYKAFKLKNDASKDFMPGWGIYYEADLAQVDTQSETGWYTLKISISDAHGNFMSQTVAPAFRLDDMAGVDTIEASPSVAEPIYYDLTGMRVADPKKGNIYIIRQGSKVTKAVK